MIYETMRTRRVESHITTTAERGKPDDCRAAMRKPETASTNFIIKTTAPMSKKRTVMATLLAIRRHARGVQNGKALKHSTVDQHMEAIVTLAGIGLKAVKGIASDTKGVDGISSCGNVSCGKERKLNE